MKKTTKTSYLRSESDRAILAARFPDLFCGKGEPKKPLAVGIVQSLFRVVPDMSRIQIRNVLKNYTGGPTYQRAIVAGAPRYGLLGNVVGHVTEIDEAYAKTRLANMAKPKRRKPKQAASEPLQLAA